MNELAEAEARVKYWQVARDKAEWAWLKHDGEPHEKERLRRAYLFTDKLLTGWERKRDRLRFERDGVPYLHLVPRTAC